MVEPLEQLAVGRHYLVATGRAFNGKSETGGWAALVQLREGRIVTRQRCVAAQQPFTTDNRMALQAAIEGVACLKAPLPVIVLSDSKYLVQGMTEWLMEWKEARWHNSSGPVKNRDLWEELDALAQARSSLEWLSGEGHALHSLNKTADALAQGAMRGMYRAGEKAMRERHPELFT